MVKEYTQTQIINLLPKGWSDITLDVYINKLLPIEIEETDEVDDMFTGIENTIKVASVFLDMDIEIVRSFPISTITLMSDRLSFTKVKPKPLKESKYKWSKNIDEPSYDSFIVYLKVMEQMGNKDFSNLPLIIKNICKDELSMEEIMMMSMDEVETGFFLLRKSLLKFLKHSALSLAMEMGKKEMKRKIKDLIKDLILFRKTSKNIENNTKKNTDGIS